MKSIIPKFIKTPIKKLIGIGNKKNIFPLNNLIHIGSKIHGYWLPGDFLTKNSICYCVGAGDDISFDTELKRIYDCNIYTFDPTPASIEHFNKIKEISRKKMAMPPLSQDSSFAYKVNFKQLEEINFIQKGVWSEKTVLKFYDPEIDGYVSHSAYLFKDSKKFIELPVDKVKNFMNEFDHESIDLLKIEIEGAEYEVIDNVIKDKVDVKVICVEFDEVFHKKGMSHLLRIQKTCNQLSDAGYLLIHSTEMLKRTFIRKDIYDQLKSRENRQIKIISHQKNR